VPILLSAAAFAVASTFGWRSGPELRFAAAPRFYATIGLLALAAAGLTFIGINPIQALFLASLIYGLLTPPLVLVVLLVTNRRTIMGRHTNGRRLNVFGSLTLLINTAAVIGLLLTGRGG
jgi:Mn2+/Fe2+ NRAMP family transporter